MAIVQKHLTQQSTIGAHSSSKSDEELLLAYRTHGEREAFEELVHRYEHELYSYLRRYLGSAAWAEDAFQSTFLQVHLKCEQFDLTRPFRPWLYSIATRQAIDTQRRNKRHKGVSINHGPWEDSWDDLGSLLNLMQSQPDPGANSETNEQRELVRKAVEELPDVLKGVIILVYYQGLKYREAAAVLDIPVGTVKSRMHSAILQLSQFLSRSDSCGKQ